MGSTRLPNLSINSTYLYYTNIFNSNFSFWYYYYFYFFFTKLIHYLFIDGLLIHFSKNKFFDIKFKQLNFLKNSFYLGSYHLFKNQHWFIIYIFIFNKTNLNNFLLKNPFLMNFLNLRKFYYKQKLNYKFLIKKKK